MKVTDSSNLVESAVVSKQEQKAFGIANVAEFFHILTSSLYSDPSLAMIRECICNAWDAHKASNKIDTPIAITLNEEFLIIEDSGTGIPHDRMHQIYCVMGESSKTYDETQTGGFGLGSKSPFAYTSNFEVTVCHGGKMAIYHLIRSDFREDGLPTITKVVETATDKTGVSVKIPLAKNQNPVEFSNKVKSVVQRGKINATLNGEQIQIIEWDSNEKVTNFNYSYAPPLTRYSNNFTRTQGSTFWVSYGNVLYPVTLKEDNDAQLELRKLQKIVQESYLNQYSNANVFIINAEPNTITVAPSREELTYTDKTIQAIKESMEYTIRKIRDSKKRASHYVNSNKDALIEEVRKKYNEELLEYNNRLSSPSAFLSLLCKNVLIKTKEAFFKQMTSENRVCTSDEWFYSCLSSPETTNTLVRHFTRKYKNYLISPGKIHKRLINHVLNSETLRTNQFVFPKRSIRGNSKNLYTYIPSNKKVLVISPNKIGITRSQVGSVNLSYNYRNNENSYEEIKKIASHLGYEIVDLTQQVKESQAKNKKKREKVTVESKLKKTAPVFVNFHAMIRKGFSGYGDYYSAISYNLWYSIANFFDSDDENNFISNPEYVVKINKESPSLVKFSIASPSGNYYSKFESVNVEHLQKLSEAYSNNSIAVVRTYQDYNSVISGGAKCLITEMFERFEYLKSVETNKEDIQKVLFDPDIANHPISHDEYPELVSMILGSPYAVKKFKLKVKMGSKKKERIIELLELNERLTQIVRMYRYDIRLIDPISKNLSEEHAQILKAFSKHPLSSILSIYKLHDYREKQPELVDKLFKLYVNEVYEDMKQKEHSNE